MNWNPFKIIDPFGIGSDVYHAVTGAPTAKEKRNQASMVAEQVQAYRDTTKLAADEIERKRGEMSSEKRRMDEKQIRGLRRSMRPAGFMDQASGNSITSKLGS